MSEAATSLAGGGWHWSRHMRARISLNAPGGHAVADPEGAARHLALVQHEARRNLQHAQGSLVTAACFPSMASSLTFTRLCCMLTATRVQARLNILHCEAAAVGALDGARVCHLPSCLGVEAGVAQHQAERPRLALQDSRCRH